MKKLTMQTPNLTDNNIERIAALFPNVITEMEDENGKLKKGINFELLRQELSGDIVESGEECYDFTWVGKKQAILEGNMPIRKTLRPCKVESKNWETTENLYIEGDNIDVLKLLQESYFNKIKMIYIDPPYNTGNDFIYKDKFSMDREEYEEHTGIYDENKNILVLNNETNGRFHSDWCSIIYPLLKLALNLLTEDGLIFISIDDNEVHNLKKICDEVFGEGNFIAELIWQNKKGGGNDSNYVAIEHEYIVAYAKDKKMLKEFYESYSEDYIKRYKETDSTGKFYWDTFKRKSGKQYYPIKCPDGTILQYDDDGNPISWLRSEKRFYEDLRIGDVRIVKIGEKWSVQFKQRLPLGKTPRSIFSFDDVLTDKGTTSSGSDDVYKYFKKDVFSNPKPVSLLEFILGFGLQQGETVLDFFSGSGTITEAVMRCNRNDGGNRKYICVQIEENLDEVLVKTPSNKRMIIENAIDFLDELKLPHTIPELAKERIRRAGEQIKKEIEDNAQQLKMGEEPKQVPDIGFRVLKVDSTNMKDVYYSADQYSQQMLDDMISNIKEDRTDMDLLYQVLLDWGLPLNLKHETEVIEGVSVHTVDGDALMACFNDNVPESVVREMAKRKPLRVVFRDSSFADSPSKINVEEIFKLNAPGTDVRVI